MGIIHVSCPSRDLAISNASGFGPLPTLPNPTLHLDCGDTSGFEKVMGFFNSYFSVAGACSTVQQCNRMSCSMSHELKVAAYGLSCVPNGKHLHMITRNLDFNLVNFILKS